MREATQRRPAKRLYALQPMVLPARRFVRMTKRSLSTLVNIFALELARTRAHARRLKITKCRIIATNRTFAHTRTRARARGLNSIWNFIVQIFFHYANVPNNYSAAIYTLRN